MNRTPLYPAHQALGARFVPFGGWEMPVQYPGIVVEHRGGAEVIDRSAELALLALQGPQATAILAALTDVALSEVPPFAFREGRVAGRQTLIAHTGYTGEDGWELYCASQDATAVWD